MEFLSAPPKYAYILGSALSGLLGVACLIYAAREKSPKTRRVMLVLSGTGIYTAIVVPILMSGRIPSPITPVLALPIFAALFWIKRRRP